MKKLTKFEELGISPETLKSLNEWDLKKQLLFKLKRFQWVWQSKDLIGQAQTGTGKTAAFGIPLVEKIDIKRT